MPSINQITLVGHLGAAPERIDTRTGTPMARMSLATNTRRNDQEHTDWHRVTCFGRQAEAVLANLGKGDLCYVEGRITYQRVERDGDVRYYTDIVARRVIFLQRKGRNGQPTAVTADADTAMTDGFSEERIPF